MSKVAILRPFWHGSANGGQNGRNLAVVAGQARMSEKILLILACAKSPVSSYNPKTLFTQLKRVSKNQTSCISSPRKSGTSHKTLFTQKVTVFCCGAVYWRCGIFWAWGIGRF